MNRRIRGIWWPTLWITIAVVSFTYMVWRLNYEKYYVPVSGERLCDSLVVKLDGKEMALFQGFYSEDSWLFGDVFQTAGGVYCQKQDYPNVFCWVTRNDYLVWNGTLPTILTPGSCP